MSTSAIQRMRALEQQLYQAQCRQARAEGKPMPPQPGRAPGTKPGATPTEDEEVDENGDPIVPDEEEDLECRWNDAVSKYGAVGANRRFPGLRARLVSVVNARHQRQVAVSRSGRRRRR